MYINERRHGDKRKENETCGEDREVGSILHNTKHISGAKHAQTQIQNKQNKTKQRHKAEQVHAFHFRLKVRREGLFEQ